VFVNVAHSAQLVVWNDVVSGSRNIANDLAPATSHDTDTRMTSSTVVTWSRRKLFKAFKSEISHGSAVGYKLSPIKKSCGLIVKADFFSPSKFKQNKAVATQKKNPKMEIMIDSPSFSRNRTLRSVQTLHVPSLAKTPSSEGRANADEKQRAVLHAKTPPSVGREKANEKQREALNAKTRQSTRKQKQVLSAIKTPRTSARKGSLPVMEPGVNHDSQMNVNSVASTQLRSDVLLIENLDGQVVQSRKRTCGSTEVLEIIVKRARYDNNHNHSSKTYVQKPESKVQKNNGKAVDVTRKIRYKEPPSKDLQQLYEQRKKSRMQRYSVRKPASHSEYDPNSDVEPSSSGSSDNEMVTVAGRKPTKSSVILQSLLNRAQEKDLSVSDGITEGDENETSSSEDSGSGFESDCDELSNSKDVITLSEWHETAGNHLHFEYSGLDSTHVDGDKPLDFLRLFIDDDVCELGRVYRIALKVPS
jgi:hypothetical protein